MTEKEGLDFALNHSSHPVLDGGGIMRVIEERGPRGTYLVSTGPTELVSHGNRHERRAAQSRARHIRSKQ